MLDFIINIFSSMFSIFTDLRRVKVCVHKAHFTKREKTEAYYINVTNMSRSREIEITHVYFDCDGNQVHALPPDRPLPRRLKPDETWETWIELDLLPDWVHESPYELGRVRLSTYKTIKSVKCVNIPKRGSIPGGPVFSYDDQETPKE
jgi:hypothetical protein